MWCRMYNLLDQSSLWFRPDGVWVAKVVWMISILEKDNVLLDLLAICFVFTEVDWTVTKLMLCNVPQTHCTAERKPQSSYFPKIFSFCPFSSNLHG